MAAEVVALALASVVTPTLNTVGDVPPIALTLTAALSDEVAVTPFQPVKLASDRTASDKADTIDLIWP